MSHGNGCEARIAHGLPCWCEVHATVNYSQAKDILRMWGVKHLLGGAGACAAMVRAAWYLRLAALAETRREVAVAA